MTSVPSGSEFAQAFLDSCRTTLGIAGDLRNLSRWNRLGQAIGAVANRIAQSAVQAHDAVLLERAVGDDLDGYCTARGPVRRKPASSAIGIATLNRATSAGGSGTIPAGSTMSVAYQGKSYQFATSQDWQVGATDLTAPIPIAATITGAASGALGLVTTSLALTGTSLFDTSFTLASISVANGADAETDAQLRDRQRAWERGKRGGVRAAVAYGALNVPGISHVVTAAAFGGLLGGYSTVYVGDDGWNSVPAILTAVATELENWRAWGQACYVRGMSQTDVSITGTITMARPIANYSVTALLTAATRAATDYFNNRIDPYAYDLTMLSGRVARIHDEVQTVALAIAIGGVITPTVVSPLSPSSVTLNGGLPSTLVRYRLLANNVQIQIQGPQ